MQLFSFSKNNNYAAIWSYQQDWMSNFTTESSITIMRCRKLETATTPLTGAGISIK